MANSFTGTFSSPAKEAEFMAVTTELKAFQFRDEENITSISMPLVTTVGDSPFLHSTLNKIELPSVITIEESHGHTFKLSSSAIIDLPSLKVISETMFDSSGTTSLTILSANEIGSQSFIHAKLTSLTIPEVTSIGDSAFSSSSLNTDSILLPKVKSLGGSVFGLSNFTHVDLPELETATGGLFPLSPIVYLNIPKLKTFPLMCFTNIVNEHTTIVKMDRSLDTKALKDKLFIFFLTPDDGGWDKINFVWPSPKNTITFNGKIVSHPIPYKNKKIIGLTINNKHCLLTDKKSNIDISDINRSWIDIDKLVIYKGKRFNIKGFLENTAVINEDDWQGGIKSGKYNVPYAGNKYKSQIHWMGGHPSIKTFPNTIKDLSAVKLTITMLDTLDQTLLDEFKTKITLKVKMIYGYISLNHNGSIDNYIGGLITDNHTIYGTIKERELTVKLSDMRSFTNGSLNDSLLGNNNTPIHAYEDIGPAGDEQDQSGAWFYGHDGDTHYFSVGAYVNGITGREDGVTILAMPSLEIL